MRLRRDFCDKVMICVFCNLILNHSYARLFGLIKLSVSTAKSRIRFVLSTASSSFRSRSSSSMKVVYFLEICIACLRLSMMSLTVLTNFCHLQTKQKKLIWSTSSCVPWKRTQPKPPGERQANFCLDAHSKPLIPLFYKFFLVFH
jgi:hypothetical protein